MSYPNPPAPEPSRRMVGRIVGGLAGALLLAVLTGIGLLFAGPRAIPFAEDELEREVAEMARPYTVKGERLSARLVIDHGVMLDLSWTNARITDGGGSEVARLPEASVRLAILDLLIGQARLRSVHVRGAELLIARDAAGHWQLGLRGGQPRPGGELSSLGAIGNRVRSIELEDTALFLVGDGREGRLVVPEARFRVDPMRIALDATVAADATSGLSDAVHARLVPSSGGWSGRANLVVQRVDRYALLLPMLGGYGGGFTGEATIQLSAAGNLDRIAASFHDNGAARYGDPAMLSGTVPIDRFGLTLSGHGESGVFVADRIDLGITSGELKLDGKGALRFGSEVTGDFTLEGSGLPAERLKDYWPLPLAPETRAWVVANILHGRAGKSTCRIRLEPGDTGARLLPAHVIEAVVPVTGVELIYLPQMPPVTGIDGRLHITGRSFDFTATKAATLSETTARGTVTLPDFQDGSLPIVLHLDIDAPARDVAEALSKDRLDLADELKLDPGWIVGKGQGALDLFVTLYPREAGPIADPATQIEYRIAATLAGVGQPGILGKWDVESLNGAVAIDPSTIDLAADASLQGVPGHLTIHREGEPPRSAYRWQARMPIERFAAFGIELPAGSSGTADLDARISEEKGGQHVKAEADLTTTAIDIAPLRYSKPLGKPASLSIDYARAADGSASVPAFRYRSEGDDIGGSLTFGPDRGLLGAQIPSARLNGSDFALDYRTRGTRRSITLRGERIDVSPWWGAKPGQGGDRFAALHDLDFEFEARRLILDPDSELRRVGGHLSCDALCETATFDGFTASDRPVSWRLSRIDGKRRLAVQASDAGSLIRALGYSDHVHGGELTLQGSFADDKPKRPLEARLMIERFRLQNAPTLTKMLTLASLTGLGDTVSGRGIGFRRLSGDIVYADGDILLKDMRAVGTALGVLLDGALDNSGRIGLNGTMVPSYAANSLIGKIPLIGEALVGGEGQGLIGARFSVEGSLEKPDVTVNPLSVLTPGFLRNIFGIGDDDPEEAAKKIQGKPDADDRKDELPPPPPRAGASDPSVHEEP